MQGMKNTYICKCGRIVRKSTNADTTGNRDTAQCTGCPYLLPWGDQEYIPGEGFHLKVKGYECRVSKSLEYTSQFGGSVNDKCTCYVASLDYDFLSQINDWIHQTYSDDELLCNFSIEKIRPTDFISNGRYKYVIACAQNKKGIAAKATLLERFFNPDRSRKDMTPEEEERKIKDLIENGKRAAQGAAPEPEHPPAVPEEKLDILAAENQIFVDPNGVKYRIGIEKGFGKKTYWRTERMDNGEWIPNNSSSYPKFENAQGEFAACIRVHSLVPMEPENEDSTVTTALSAAPMAADTSGTTEALATVANALPAFDYSGLDTETATHLQNLARRALESKQRYYLDMMEIVFEAHREVVPRWDNSKHGNRGESTFVAWCASIGVSKTSAYRLLQVQALMDNSTPEEQETLEKLPAKALYEIARPSTPAEAVAAAKSGDITTYKAYQKLMEQLMAEQNARKAAEQKAQNAQAREEEARAAAHRYHVEKEDAEAQRNALIDREADWAKRVADSQVAQRNAEQERDAVRDMLEKAKRRANHLVQERDDALEHLDAINSEMDELRARPIEVAVAEPDPAEIERLATEKAESIAAQRTAELKAQVDKLQQEAQENRAQDAEDLKMQDYDTVIFAISVIQNAWKSAGPSFHRLDDQCRAQLRRNLMERIAEIEKAVNVC